MSNHGMPNRIGVFDSGVGGLTVLRGLIEVLPQYDYCYLADTANLPYGERSQDELLQLTTKASEFFFDRNCPLVILACNTVSSQALRSVQQTLLSTTFPDKKVLGVLVPLSEAAAKATQNRRVGVLATESTVRSNAFIRELQKVDSSIKVIQQACPLLVPLIEEGGADSAQIRRALSGYLQPLLGERVDTIILGCTHYSILEDVVYELVGSARIISAAQVVPDALVEYLHRHDEVAKKLNYEQHSLGKVEFFVTGDAAHFNEVGSRVFGTSVASQQV